MAQVNRLTDYVIKFEFIVKKGNARAGCRFPFWKLNQDKFMCLFSFLLLCFDYCFAIFDLDLHNKLVSKLAFLG